MPCSEKQISRSRVGSMALSARQAADVFRVRLGLEVSDEDSAALRTIAFCHIKKMTPIRKKLRQPMRGVAARRVERGDLHRCASGRGDSRKSHIYVGRKDNNPRAA